jgi:dolichol-phosphate mannosyltransferase
MADQVDIVIPVFNEAENIEPVLRALTTHVKTPFRVLICYDMDSDNTLPVCRDFAARQPIAMNYVKNPGRGPHSAVVAGFRFSEAAAVLVLPADDDYNAPQIDLMFSSFKNGNDIVCASRFMAGGIAKGTPLLKAILTRGAGFTLYHFAGLPTHDASNGLRLFSRRVLTSIPIESTQGFTYSIELLVKAHRLGYRISEVPIQWFERTRGKSRFKVGKWLFAYLRWYFYAFQTRVGLYRKLSRRQK